jgi:hypothetical protein
MNRRGFLGFLGLTGAVALVQPKIFLPTYRGPFSNLFASSVDLSESSLEDMLINLSSNPVKLVPNKIITSAEFRAIVGPMLNKVFSEEYDKHESGWAEVYRGDGVALMSAAHPVRPWWRRA